MVPTRLNDSGPFAQLTYSCMHACMHACIYVSMYLRIYVSMYLNCRSSGDLSSLRPGGLAVWRSCGLASHLASNIIE